MSPASTRRHPRRAKNLPRPGISNASPTRDGRGTLPSNLAGLGWSESYKRMYGVRRRCAQCGADMYGECMFCGTHDMRAEVEA